MVRNWNSENINWNMGVLMDYLDKKEYHKNFKVSK